MFLNNHIFVINMISVIGLYQSVGDYAAKYLSGLSIMDTFNRNLAQAQLEIISDLSPYYKTNPFINTILNTWVRRKYDSSDEYGVIQLPGVGETQIEETGEVFMRELSLGVADDDENILFEIVPIAENEIPITMRIPQRLPSIAKKRVYYLNYDNRIQLYPSEAMEFVMFYFIYPNEAKVEFTFSTDPDTGEDVQAYNELASIDLLWDEMVSNLFLYKMLQKYGIENREMMISAYAGLGIDKTLIAGGGAKA